MTTNTTSRGGEELAAKLREARMHIQIHKKYSNTEADFPLEQQLQFATNKISTVIAALDPTKSESLKARIKNLPSTMLTDLGGKHEYINRTEVLKLIAQEQEKPNAQDHPHSTTVTPRTDPEL